MPARGKSGPSSGRSFPALVLGVVAILQHSENGAGFVTFKRVKLTRGDSRATSGALAPVGHICAMVYGNLEERAIVGRTSSRAWYFVRGENLVAARLRV